MPKIKKPYIDVCVFSKSKSYNLDKLDKLVPKLKGQIIDFGCDDLGYEDARYRFFDLNCVHKFVKKINKDDARIRAECYLPGVE